MKKAGKGVTWTELLVILAIIAILIALFLPIIKEINRSPEERAKITAESQRQALSKIETKNLGKGVYLLKDNDAYIGVDTWYQALENFIKNSDWKILNVSFVMDGHPTRPKGIVIVTEEGGVK